MSDESPWIRNDAKKGKITSRTKVPSPGRFYENIGSFGTLGIGTVEHLNKSTRRNSENYEIKSNRSS